MDLSHMRVFICAGKLENSVPEEEEDVETNPQGDWSNEFQHKRDGQLIFDILDKPANGFWRPPQADLCAGLTC